MKASFFKLQDENLLKANTCNRIELKYSIENAMSFAVLFIVTNIAKLILLLFNDFTLYFNLPILFYYLFSIITCSLIYYALRIKIKPQARKASNSLENLFFYKLIVQVIGIIYVIFCFFLFVFSQVEQEILTSAFLPCLFNLLFFICHLVIRSSRINCIIYGIFMLFLYRNLNSSTSYKKDLMLTLIESSFVSLFISSKCNCEKFHKVHKFLKSIIDQYNIIYSFLKSIPDIIFLETKRNPKNSSLPNKELISFLNDSGSKVPLCPKTFNVSSEPIFDSKNLSLKQKIDQLRECKLEVGQNVKISEDDYHNSNVENRKIYNVVVIKIQIDKKETLGLYIKNITETANLISHATSLKVSNMHICTFSHEIRNPLNQVLGILIKLKKESKNIFMKSNLGMAKAAFLRLCLRFEIYLDYNMLLNQTLEIKSIPTTLSKIFREIKRMNYEYFYHNFNKEISIKLDPAIRNTKINLKSKPVIIIIQYIIEKLASKNNLNHITLGAFLNHEEKRVEFLISEGVKGEKIVDTNLFKKVRKKPIYNSLFSKSGQVEIVSELCINFIEKLKVMINAKIKSTINEKEEEMHCISLEFSKASIEEKDVFSEEDFTEFEIGGKEVYPNYKKMIETISKVKSHIFPIEKGRRSTQAEELKSVEKPITLVVDDDIMNRFAICGMLKSFDVRIIEAEDGQVCLNKYNSMNEKEKERLIIFMDLSMPNMDGISCCSMIRNIESKRNAQKVPIIAITGHDSEIERRKAKDVGMTDFYSKPIQKDTIKELLNRHLLFK